MDLESFYPAKERFELSMGLNNLLASPGFASWMEGEPLDIARLLHTAEGRPCLSILSMAHLSEAQRMFFVTLLLSEVMAWMRTQPGTGSLRAILYMDEIYGFLPPTANPPSKKPMMTLLKQARAYGLGVVLATQNPVDLDYKGLSNAGTWFLGRLQTERDKSRVLEGLEGASTSAGQSFDRGKMEETLSRLKSRVFLMNNVHEDRPVQFHTRWALSYLRGPLTRVQIQKLMDPRRPSPATVAPPTASPKAAVTLGGGEVSSSLGHGGLRPVLPPGIEEGFLPATRSCEAEEKLLYRPALLGAARLHYSQARTDIDVWKEVCLLAPLDARESADPWKGNQAREQGAPDWESEPESSGHFDKLRRAATQPRSYTTWTKQLKDHLYRTQTLPIWTCQSFEKVSEVGESEGDFRVRLGLMAHEKRDAEVEKLRKRYAPKLAGLEERIRRTEHQVQREQSQYQQQKTQTMISVGATLLGALFGRKVASVGTVGRATTSMRGMARSAREKSDIRRAQDSLETLRQRLEELEASFEEEAEQVRDRWDPESLELKELRVRPRKSDITVDRLALAWVPWIVDAAGVVRPAFSDE